MLYVLGTAWMWAPSVCFYFTQIYVFLSDSIEQNATAHIILMPMNLHRARWKTMAYILSSLSAHFFAVFFSKLEQSNRYVMCLFVHSTWLCILITLSKTWIFLWIYLRQMIETILSYIDWDTQVYTIVKRDNVTHYILIHGCTRNHYL